MSSSPIRRSAARKKKAYKGISPKTGRPQKPQCCFCNSSCASCTVFPPLQGEGAGRGGVGSARIKEELLREFNLHTIVRLPNGVFAPYTGIPTNVLFFDRGGPTQHVWYYEQPLPEGRKNYTKTAPIGQRPHKMSVAAVALSHSIDSLGFDHRFTPALAVAFGKILSQVELNGTFFGFNSTDQALLSAAANVFH